MTNSELLLPWKTWDTDTGWRSGEIELDKLTLVDENFVTKNMKKKFRQKEYQQNKFKVVLSFKETLRDAAIGQVKTTD